MKRANADWEHIKEHGYLLRVDRRLKRIYDDAVREVVALVFHRNNRQLMAHGSKKSTTGW